MFWLCLFLVVCYSCVLEGGLVLLVDNNDNNSAGGTSGIGVVGNGVRSPLPRFSHSQLNTYMQCGEKWRLERLYGLGGDISWALLGGSAFHTWTELFDSGFEVSPEYFVNVLEQAVKDELASESSRVTREADIRATGRKSKEWPNKRDRYWWEHHGPLFCEKYVEWRNSPDNVVYPVSAVADVEKRVSGKFGDFSVVGAVDRFITVSPFGEPVVLDLKTGKEPGNVLQLATYAVLLSELTGVKVSKGAYYLAESGTVSEVHDLSVYGREFVESLYVQAGRGLSNGVFLPNPGAFCSTCSVQPMCRLYGGVAPVQVPLLENVC